VIEIVQLIFTSYKAGFLLQECLKITLTVFSNKNNKVYILLERYELPGK